MEGKEDILEGPSLKPFGTLQLGHKLPLKEQYKYTQIAHLLKKNSQLLTILPAKVTQYYLQLSILPKGLSPFV